MAKQTLCDSCGKIISGQYYHFLGAELQTPVSNMKNACFVDPGIDPADLCFDCTNKVLAALNIEILDKDTILEP